MKRLASLLIFLIITPVTFAQNWSEFVPDYDESKVPKFEIPDPPTSFKCRVLTNLF